MLKTIAPIGSMLLLLSPVDASTTPASLWMPLAGSATLCDLSGKACRKHRFERGSDLGNWIDAMQRASHAPWLRVQLDAGDADLTQTWSIDGTRLPRIRRIEIAGAPQHRSRLTGAAPLTSITREVRQSGSGIIRLSVSARVTGDLAPMPIERGTAGPPVIYDSGGALHYARWPNQGSAPFRDGIASTGGARLVPIDVARLRQWRDERAAWLWGEFNFEWHREHRRIASASVATQQIEVSPRPDFGIAPTSTFAILNAISELDDPREFHLDAQQRQISLHASRQSQLESLRISLLRAPLIHIKNIENFSLRDIALEQTRGHAIVIEDSSQVTIMRAVIRDVGASAIVVKGGYHVDIANVDIRDTGQDAVILEGGDRATLTPASHAIRDSRIARPGQWVMTPSAAVRLLGVGNAASDNAISDTPQLAIYFEGNEHDIANNDIDRACAQLTDCGAIYAGRDWTFRGNRIRGNSIENTRPAKPGRTVAAIYLDDMLSGTLVERNLIIGVPFGVLLGGGRDNTIVNNFFVDSERPIHIDDRALGWAKAAVAPGEVMRTRLAAMPVSSGVWAKAYPKLAEMRLEVAAQPAGNVFVDNAGVDSGPATLSFEGGFAFEAPKIALVAIGGTAKNAAAIRNYCLSQAACRFLTTQ